MHHCLNLGLLGKTSWICNLPSLQDIKDTSFVSLVPLLYTIGTNLPQEASASNLKLNFLNSLWPSLPLQKKATNESVLSLRPPILRSCIEVSFIRRVVTISAYFAETSH